MQSTPLLRSILSAAVLVGGLAVVELFAGCDASFDPYEPNSDRYYSIYGVIDASAERQTIRVERLGDFERGDAIQGTVTSTHVASGRTETWRDTTLRLIGQDRQRRLRNYWTDADFQPGETYRLQVRGANGSGTTSVEVTLPDKVPQVQLSRTPQCIPVSNFDYSPTTLRVSGVSQLADVRATYDTSATSPSSGGAAPFEVRHLSDTTTVDDHTYSVPIDWYEETGTCHGLHSFSITVATAGSDWPAAPASHEIGAGDMPQEQQPEVSNVQNGFGFVGGVLSTTVQVPITTVEQ